MNDNKIKSVIAARFNNIKKRGKKIRKHFAAKEIHGFRTEVKKLRAYIRLVTFVPTDSQEYKLPKKFREIYSTAGAIRDIQLQLERIKEASRNESRQPEQYEALLKHKIKKAKKKLKKLLDQTSISSIQKKVLVHLPKQLSLETVRNFIQEKRADIKLLSEKKEEQDDDIHSIRKDLKDLMYNVKSVKDVYLVEAFPPELKDAGKLKSVEQLTDQLGMFTDMTAAISFTEPLYLDAVEATEKEQLQYIRNKWLQEKRGLRETAIKDISTMHTESGEW